MGRHLDRLHLPTISFPFDATWQPDLFGRIREHGQIGCLRSAGQRGGSRESPASPSRPMWPRITFNFADRMRSKQLLDSTVIAYQSLLDLTKALYETGIDSDEAVAQAETQLESTQAQDAALGIQRAQFEHAIAMLTGQPASTFSIPVETAQINSSGNSLRRSVPASRAASRHRRGRAPGGSGQRADWHCESGILSDGYVKRRGRTRKLFVRELVHVAEPLFLGRPDGRGNHF